jgi:hypothetical protein
MVRALYLRADGSAGMNEFELDGSYDMSISDPMLVFLDDEVQLLPIETFRSRVVVSTGFAPSYES